MVSYCDKLGGHDDCLQAGIAVHTTSFSTAFVRQLMQAQQAARVAAASRSWKTYARPQRVRHAFSKQAFCWGGVDDLMPSIRQVAEAGGCYRSVSRRYHFH
jgi:hypothetical protein